MSSTGRKMAVIGLTGVLTFLSAGMSVTYADSDRDQRSRYSKYEKHHRYGHDQRRDHHGDRHRDDRYDHVIHRGHEYDRYPRHVRKYKDVNIVRYYGHHYHGYGHHHSDDDAYKWLAFTAITLKVLDNLNEHQQRVHEAAQVAATNARVGETILWNDAGASGSVTVLRDGTSTAGRYCREFQQEVIIGGRRESAYGTACRQPDGSWEMIATGT